MSKHAVGGTMPNQDTNAGILGRYEAVIGLEVHCQLNTSSKLFCGCPTKFGAMPNHASCPTCLGYPGTLPVLNRQAVDFAIRAALAVGAEIHNTSVFARKQYFYPDLPKGYQITQFDKPYCTNGKLTLTSGKEIRIARIHIEEDAGKSIHGEDASFVDLNRAGTPLIEIVSAPEIHLPEEASDYLKRLHSLVRYLEICDGNLEEGSFRCDANVSIRRKGDKSLGTRCEIKNLNSFRNIEKAITYEIIRQADLLDAGTKILQQTMLYDAASGRTVPMRSKEESHDYRYFPDPDLLPLKILPTRIESIRAALPELPEAMSKRFQERFALPEYDANVLTAEKPLAEFFEKVVHEVGDAVSPKIVANWVHSEFLREANNRSWDLAKPPVTAENLARLLRMIGAGSISGKIAKTVFEQMANHGGDAEEIVKSHGLVQVSDAAAVAMIVEQVIADHPAQIEQYKSGKDKVYGFFVGQIMKVSGGKLNPGVVNGILKDRLDALKSSG